MLEILHINTQRGASETRCAGIGYAVLHRNGREEHATVLIDLLAVGDEEEEMLGEEVSMVLFLCICVLISNPGRLSKGEVFARSIEAEHVVDAWIIRDRVLRIEREVVSVKKVNQTVSSSRNTIVNKVCHSRLCYIYKEYSFRVYITIIMQKVKGYVVFIRIKKTIQVFFLSFGTCQPIVRHVSASCLARVSLSFVMYRPIVRRSTNIHAPFDKQLCVVRQTIV